MNNCKISGSPGVVQSRAELMATLIKRRREGQSVVMMEDAPPMDIRVVCETCTPDCSNATRWDKPENQTSLESEWNANNA